MRKLEHRRHSLFMIEWWLLKRLLTYAVSWHPCLVSYSQSEVLLALVDTFEYRRALVVRDWTRGQGLGHYTIQPSQFNTRMPLHINDEELCPTISSPDECIKITERPRSKFTALSYTIHLVEIATLVRESVDLRDLLLQSPGPSASRVVQIRNDLRRKYDTLLAVLPPHFQIGNEAGLTPDDLDGPLAAVPVHRWILHQQLWTLFLRFHRAGLSSFDERAACRSYAKKHH